MYIQKLTSLNSVICKLPRVIHLHLNNSNEKRTSFKIEMGFQFTLCRFYRLHKSVDLPNIKGDFIHIFSFLIIFENNE